MCFFFQVAETCQLAVQRIEWLKEKCLQENDHLRLAWFFVAACVPFINDKLYIKMIVVLFFVKFTCILSHQLRIYNV